MAQNEIKKVGLGKALQKDWIDVTVLTTRYKLGHIHPITKMLWRAEDIFQKIPLNRYQMWQGAPLGQIKKGDALFPAKN